MNLNKLKELEGKASSAPWYSYYTKRDDVALTVELRNSAKEMISTIERYKSVMEMIVNNPDYTNPEKMVRALREALKDPEKTSGPESREGK